MQASQFRTNSKLQKLNLYKLKYQSMKYIVIQANNELHKNWSCER